MSVTSQPLSNKANAKRVLIAGCGDLGLRVAKRLSAEHPHNQSARL
jgi:phosphoglycerate dehydrogenase-like enzyme